MPCWFFFCCCGCGCCLRIRLSRTTFPIARLLCMRCEDCDFVKNNNIRECVTAYCAVADGVDSRRRAKWKKIKEKNKQQHASDRQREQRRMKRKKCDRNEMNLENEKRVACVGCVGMRKGFMRRQWQWKPHRLTYPQTLAMPSDGVWGKQWWSHLATNCFGSNFIYFFE